MTILGISVGSLRTGVCILKSGELIEWQVHGYPNKWSQHKLQMIVNRYRQYIQEYNVSAIALKIPPLKSHSKAETQLIKKIEKLAKEYDCKYDLFTKDEIKHRTSLRHTNDLIEYARILYPELHQVFLKGVPTKHRYYEKLYEAVIAAHLYKEMHKPI